MTTDTQNCQYCLWLDRDKEGYYCDNKEIVSKAMTKDYIKRTLHSCPYFWPNEYYKREVLK